MTASSFSMLRIFPASLRPWMTDPSVTDICINGPHTIFIETLHTPLQEIRSPWTDTPQPDESLKNWIMELISHLGKTWDAKRPFLDAALPTGHRVHITFPPISSLGILISIRAPAHSQLHSAPSQRWSNHSPPGAFDILQNALRDRETIIICGATGSGKTTLAQDLLSTLPAHERVLILEDTSEIRPNHPHCIALQSRPPNSDGYGEVDLRTLLRQALRMRPDRLLIGECRGPEVMDLLQALNTGHPGSLTTVHANSARDALKRIEILAALSGHMLPRSLFLDLVVSGVRWLAFTEHRTIAEICRIEGREGDTILLRAVLKKK